MSLQRSRFWAAASTAILLAVLAGLALCESRSGVGTSASRPSSTMGAVPAAMILERSESTKEGIPEAIAAPLPESLTGTEADGALIVDASGAFVATPDAIDLFDYYLSALGEEPVERIVARIEAEIRARVDPPDAALALLDQYLAYRDEVRHMVESEGLETWPLERRLQRLRETRRGIFGAERAEALFAEDEMRARNAIAWRRIADDPSLDSRERAERLADLEADWPDADRRRWARATVAARTIAHESAMRAEGASDAEIMALREAEFGAAAAARLAEIDRAREAWEARLAGYREERARLESTARADPEATMAEIEALRARWFEGPELLRVRALDEVERRGSDAR